jgi:hypothetical protein
MPPDQVAVVAVVQVVPVVAAAAAAHKLGDGFTFLSFVGLAIHFGPENRVWSGVKARLGNMMLSRGIGNFLANVFGSDSIE